MGDAKKKQVPLRLSEKLYNSIAAWAEDDFRSVNGQIEYLLTECVRQRKKNGKYVSEHLDEPLELDIRIQQYNKHSDKSKTKQTQNRKISKFCGFVILL